jgi:hypothetical protein
MSAARFTVYSRENPMPPSLYQLICERSNQRAREFAALQVRQGEAFRNMNDAELAEVQQLMVQYLRPEPEQVNVVIRGSFVFVRQS